MRTTRVESNGCVKTCSEAPRDLGVRPCAGGGDGARRWVSHSALGAQRLAAPLSFVTLSLEYGECFELALDRTSDALDA